MQFSKYVPRFWPLFVSISQYLKKNCLNEDGKIFSPVLQIIKMFDSLITIKCHKSAINCIGDSQKMKIGLKLALYESDCKESDELSKELL